MCPCRTHKQETYWILCGIYTIPLSLKGSSIPYKYVVVKLDNGVEEYEYVSKGRRGGIVNRVFEVPSSVEGVGLAGCSGALLRFFCRGY